MKIFLLLCITIGEILWSIVYFSNDGAEEVPHDVPQNGDKDSETVTHCSMPSTIYPPNRS